MAPLSVNSKLLDLVADSASRSDSLCADSSNRSVEMTLRAHQRPMGKMGGIDFDGLNSGLSLEFLSVE